jgi:hypothetical protein
MTRGAQDLLNRFNTIQIRTVVQSGIEQNLSFRVSLSVELKSDIILYTSKQHNRPKTGFRSVDNRLVLKS